MLAIRGTFYFLINAILAKVELPKGQEYYVKKGIVLAPIISNI